VVKPTTVAIQTRFLEQAFGIRWHTWIIFKLYKNLEVKQFIAI
jgi:hypothetical protein